MSSGGQKEYKYWTILFRWAADKHISFSNGLFSTKTGIPYWQYWSEMILKWNVKCIATYFNDMLYSCDNPCLFKNLVTFFWLSSRNENGLWDKKSWNMLEIEIAARPFFYQRFGRSSIPAGLNIRKSWNIEYIKNAERPHVSNASLLPAGRNIRKVGKFL